MLQGYKKELAWAIGSAIGVWILSWIFPLLLLPFDAMQRQLLNTVCLVLVILVGVLGALLFSSLRRFNDIHRMFYPNGEYLTYEQQKGKARGFNSNKWPRT